MPRSPRTRRILAPGELGGLLCTSVRFSRIFDSGIRDTPRAEVERPNTALYLVREGERRKLQVRVEV
ncbi:hypothetical protein HMPREF0972_02189 [Actinomyces sp. oral taxon 848 str. F0332]|nr:hypothetical protein HMPREF0972_02189 [Actinomyces sp. oral taxon 848 str. F0332]